MTFDLDIFAKIISIIIPLLVALIKLFFVKKEKLICYYGHISAFTLQDEQHSKIHAHSIIIRNTGNKTATNVRIGHNILLNKLLGLDIHQKVSYTPIPNSNDTEEIVIPTIVPMEQITISYLYPPPLTFNDINSYVKSDEKFAEVINVIPTAQPPKYITGLFWLLILIGASSSIYWGIKLVAMLFQLK